MYQIAIVLLSNINTLAQFASSIFCCFNEDM